MLLEQVSVKVFASEGSEVAQDEYIPVFHRWIREARVGGGKLLIDVADYRHVPEGPGVMLVGHQAHWGMDEAEGLGMKVSQKRDEPGPVADKLREAFRDAFEAAAALADEPVLAGRLAFGGERLNVQVLSRRAAPNTAETFQAVEPALRALLQDLYPDAEVELTHRDDPRRPFQVDVSVSASPGAAAVWERLRS